jgi:beta-galactosidase/beta-glucuronidase
MIRKHVKVEPARWYSHCDREGILVWQNMPSGDASPQWQSRNYFSGQEFQRSAASEENYRREWHELTLERVFF